MKRPLLVGLVISTGVHAGVLGALLAARSSSPPPAPMRVRVLAGRSEPGPAEVSAPGQSGASNPPPVSRPAAVSERQKPRPVPGAAAPGGGTSGARTAPASTAVTEPGATEPSSDTAGRAARRSTTQTVQDDIWVITDEGQGEGTDQPAAGPPEGGGGAEAPGPRGALSPLPGSGTGGSGPPSLLLELNRRLAWSAARCAPTGAVRSSRGGAPEVPLHFCLDAAGRPSAVGLEGTTGSELLDRAARECVIPGAAPLPPLPGCYTVAVRFPVRQ